MSKTRKLRRARNARDEEIKKSELAMANMRQARRESENVAELCRDFIEEWTYHRDFIKHLFGNKTGALTPEKITSSAPILRMLSRIDANKAPYGYSQAESMRETIMLMSEIRCVLEATRNDIMGTIELYAHFVRDDGAGNISYAYSHDMREMLLKPEVARYVLKEFIQDAGDRLPHELSKLLN